MVDTSKLPECPVCGSKGKSRYRRLVNGHPCANEWHGRSW